MIAALEKYSGKIDTTMQSKLYLRILDNDYSNKSYFSVLYMNKNIEIRVMSKDTSSKVDYASSKWKLNGVEISGGEVLQLNCSKASLSRDTNTLGLWDSAGVCIASLKITPYHPPIVTLDMLDRNDASYFFDNGYEKFPELRNDYKTFTLNRRNATTTYVPVLGINLMEQKKLKVKYSVRLRLRDAGCSDEVLPRSCYGLGSA